MAGYSSALVLLVLLVAVAVWLLWRRPRQGPGGRSSASLRMLEAFALGPRDRLLLVECDGRRYLLSQGVQGVRLLDRLDAPAPAAVRSPGEVLP
ncbi:flagellar biosynthetic protein FliO [Hydrogenophaga sp.]|uniref:flagellar biosynthetic protein FliO n=1 Tax=Hydrogenophaga sp. TaxID=1904254 RepID=UPI003F6CA396